MSRWATIRLSKKTTAYLCIRLLAYTVRSESRCALRLRYVDLFVSVEVAVDVGGCFAVFSC
jgi:hypothetical protein